MSRLIAPGLHAWAIRRRTHAGFTLVELMIAVCVAAALLGIALPAYQQYRERIRIDQAKQDIMAMSAIIANYQDAHAYPDSLPTSGSATSLDPWGHPYGYLNLGDKKGHGHARKDHSLVPINTDFDLYSMGPDGLTAPPLTAKHSRDDIVRANNGAFVGTASEY